MDWNALLAPLVRYTLLAALATVGAAYLAFQSGLTLLLLTGAGLMLIVLGAGEAGAAPAAGFGETEDMEMGGLSGETDLSPVSALLPGSSNYSLRVKLLFYGIGLVVWNVVGLAVLLG